MFDPKLKEEINFLVRRFKQMDKVKSVKEVVDVDEVVPGCPMEEGVFFEVLDKYLKEFGVVNA